VGALLLFLPGGVVAIIYGLLVNRRLSAGDWMGAAKASRLARIWILISVAWFAVALILYHFGIVKGPHLSN
jgi:Interferon-induced transmembrane protein